MSIGELAGVINEDELCEEMRMKLRLKEVAGESSQFIIIILRELQSQQARIDLILE